MLAALLLLACGLFPWTGFAMRADHVARLRKETVGMFHHGFSNYIEHGFPEDELRPLSCVPLSRDPIDPTNLVVNDALGNYSLTLIDSLSTLAILAGGPQEGTYTGAKALTDFQDGIAEFVRLYGDGRLGPSGTGTRSTGFDLDSKIQLFETVIRGLGGLLSAHLFAIGELPITGYHPGPAARAATDDPLELPPIQWPNGFQYDGQLLRLALDLGQRLLPAFYTVTGIPYPRVNLRYGIPFYAHSPLNQRPDGTWRFPDPREVTETCSAGAGSLTLEFTVLSRLSGDPRFEQAAKRSFWAVWERRSEIGLIGNAIDAERGIWLGPHSGIGAGMDSFFEYAFKSHVLLSGHDAPNVSAASRPQSTIDWVDPNSIHPPLAPELQTSEAFLEAWREAHAAVKRYLYTDRSAYPYYSNIHRSTGQPFTMWIDSLGAFYPGLLALAGEIDEAIEGNLVYTALWTRYSAIPERWSVRDNGIDAGLGWWPGRPEFIESTYYIYRATQDPWYLYVGEMVLRDVRRRCKTSCGWAGLQDVRTGEKADRMESFFLGETTKYMYLLFDPDHPLNKLDAAWVFSTEGHPLIIPSRSRAHPNGKRPGQPAVTSLSIPKNDSIVDSCPAIRPTEYLFGSVTAARPHLFDVSRFTDLYNTPDIHGPTKTVQVRDKKKDEIVTMRKPIRNYTLFPWTLPPTILPQNGTCAAPEVKSVSWIEFPGIDAASSLVSQIGASVVWYSPLGYLVRNLVGLQLQLERAPGSALESQVWKIAQAGSTQIGRQESVFFHAESVKHMSDEAFSVSRRQDVVDVELLVDEPPQPQQNESMPCSITDTVVQDSIPSDSDNPSATESLIKSLFRAMSSVFEPLATELPQTDMDGPLIYDWEAATPVGPGAFPLPPVEDTPIKGSPNFNSKNPLANFPWTSVFLAGHACDGPLPESSSREHQVIVMLRGGCAFSEKLDKIPSFSPQGRHSLKLVIVVDEAAYEDGAEGGDEQTASSGSSDYELARPLLDREQQTPKGMRRPNGMPMVLMRAGPGDYELFGRARGVGLRRRYQVQSQGLPVENAVVL